MDPQRLLVEIPAGPTLDGFHPVQLAAAIEQELKRAQAVGWTKISLNMDLIDAAALARFLRLGMSGPK